MFTITIYASGKKEGPKFEHITRVEYKAKFSETIVLEGADIMTHKYPTSYDLHLFSDEASYTISAKTIGAIEVRKEA